MIRGYRRITPRLRGDPEAELSGDDTENPILSDDEYEAALDAFEAKYGDVQLPKEAI